MINFGIVKLGDKLGGKSNQRGKIEDVTGKLEWNREALVAVEQGRSGSGSGGGGVGGRVMGQGSEARSATMADDLFLSGSLNTRREDWANTQSKFR